jgi:hypothetical protein
MHRAGATGALPWWCCRSAGGQVPELDLAVRGAASEGAAIWVAGDAEHPGPVAHAGGAPAASSSRGGRGSGTSDQERARSREVGVGLRGRCVSGARGSCGWLRLVVPQRRGCPQRPGPPHHPQPHQPPQIGPPPKPSTSHPKPSVDATVTIAVVCLIIIRKRSRPTQRRSGPQTDFELRPGVSPRAAPARRS